MAASTSIPIANFGRLLGPVKGLAEALRPEYDGMKHEPQALRSPAVRWQGKASTKMLTTYSCARLRGCNRRRKG